MNDALLVRMLDSLADLREQLQAVAEAKFLLVAIIRDARSGDQFHDEVRPARFRRASIQHLGNVRMIHPGQGLSLGFEAGDDIASVQTGLDHFECDSPPDRLFLFGKEYDSPTAFPELLLEANRGRSVGRSLRLPGDGVLGAKKDSLSARVCVSIIASNRWSNSGSLAQARSRNVLRSDGGSSIASPNSCSSRSVIMPLRSAC